MIKFINYKNPCGKSHCTVLKLAIKELGKTDTETKMEVQNDELFKEN